MLTFFRLHIAFIRYFQPWDIRLCYLTVVLQNQFKIFLHFSMQVVSAITGKLRFFSHDLERFTLIRTHKGSISNSQHWPIFPSDTNSKTKIRIIGLTHGQSASDPTLIFLLTSDISQSFGSICGTQTLLYGPSNPMTCPCHIPRFYSKMALKFICSQLVSK